MKILQLIQKPQLRGAEIFASQLSTHLADAGHDVRMVCLLPGESKLPFPGTIVRFDRPLNKRFFDIAGWRQLADYIREFQPDIVQANAGDTLKFAVFSRLMFGWKSRLVFRNANKVSDFIDTKPKLWLNRFFARRVDHVISVSELCRQDFVRTYGVAADRTTTVPIGIEETAHDLPLPADCAAYFNTPVLLNVGSLVPEKNQAALVRITKALVDTGIPVCTLIVGDGRLRPELEQQIRSLGLQQHVYLLGYRKDVLALMRHARAFAMPSKIEGLPGVILEAFYYDLPVVASDVGGISEVVMPGKTGWLIAKDDEAAFIAAAREALTITESSLQIRRDARAEVERAYLNRQIAQRFAGAYQRVVTRN
jgi:L-malate glycosyltransferase